MMGGGPVGMPAGYVSGGEVKGYEQAIEDTAKLFASSDPKNRDYMENIHWYSKNLAGGHRVPKEQVMQDLMKAIEAQRGAMPVKKGIMERLQEKMGGSTQKLNQLGSPEDINFSPTGMVHGGIARLETGGLFEGEEIVEINPMLNQMAGQGGSGIASVSTEPAPGAAPERNVPNERGIIELAMDTEEVEDDEPMIAFAKQEAQGRLSEEFNILRSTAQAEAASGNPPSAVIKSSMDDLARSARRIENETVEKYPEVPANANLISSDDLIPYREELVAIFETPEVGSEEPLMDTAILAKRGGLIPGYEDGGVTEVPEEWAWIDEDIRESGVSLKEAEALMIKKYGPEIAKLRKMYETETDPETLTKRRVEERLMPADELIKRRKEQQGDTRVTDLVEAMKTGKFMGSTKPKILPHVGGTGTTILPMEAGTIKDNIGLAKKYGKTFDEEGNLRPMPIELEEIEVTAQKRGGPETVDQGLSFQDTGQDLTAILKAGKDAGMSNTEIMELIKLLQQSDPLAGVKAQAETLKDTTNKQLDSVTSILNTSVKQYETDARKQDKDMRDIFDDIERRIPEQAKYRALSTPTQTVGSGATAVKKGLLRKSFEQDRFQQNNRDKIEFENLRKKETEARRNQDIKALYDIKLKQYDIISSIDESMLEGEKGIAKAEYENQMARDLEKLKVEIGSTGQAYAIDAIMAQKEKSEDSSVEEDMASATRLGGPAYSSERYPELGGERTAVAGNSSRKVTFPEFYRARYTDGLEAKEIIEEWLKLR